MPTRESGWRDFEKVCIDTLEYLFVPPLLKPRSQSGDLLGPRRRDAVLANRMTDHSNNWGRLYHELGARMIPFEFKNYDLEDIGTGEVDQAAKYMEKHFNKFAVICCNKKPSEHGLLARKEQFTKNEKLILFLTVPDLLQMISIR